ncbi:hypothetical protein CWC29_004130 [Pseudoalteromonas sp. S4498]|uniref:hypothetical protein n=1 Tax=Pseudoalteromonas galatheae TaxID=579562 RepID=UPI00110961D6|nr:hypothetical protein [Pseudoalteromonas galatheae]NKC18032.1 hypothetical protein [Pseudoalteromonas galatheae]
MNRQLFISILFGLVFAQQANAETMSVDLTPTIEYPVEQLEPVQKALLSELLNSVTQLGDKKAACESERAITEEQLRSLNITSQQRGIVLSYFYIHQKRECEAEEYGEFARLVAANLAVQKQSEVLRFVNALNTESSSVYFDYVETELEFNQLPECVRNKAYQAEFLQHPFSLMHTLEQFE